MMCIKHVGECPALMKCCITKIMQPVCVKTHHLKYLQGKLCLQVVWRSPLRCVHTQDPCCATYPTPHWCSWAGRSGGGMKQWLIWTQTLLLILAPWSLVELSCPANWVSISGHTRAAPSNCIQAHTSKDGTQRPGDSTRRRWLPQEPSLASV